MLGVWMNPAAVIVGTFIGLVVRGRMTEKMKQIITQALGLCVAVIGISGAIKTQNSLIMIISVGTGSVIGTLIGIEARLNRLGDKIQKKISSAGSDTGAAFVGATLVFCVGSMAVVGSLEAGLSNDPSTLLAKSALDGVFSIVFASTMGFGVALSSVSLLIYQGAIALLAKYIAPFMSESMILEMGAAGSVLIMSIGLNQLGATKKPIPVGDMLPSVFMPVIIILITDAVKGILN